MTWRTIGHYAAYVFLWIVSSALCVWLTLEFIEMLNSLAFRLVTINPDPDNVLYLQVNRFIAFSKCIAIPTGILGVVMIVWLEEYYRRGVGKKILWQRALRVLGIQGVLLIIIEGLLYIL